MKLPRVMLADDHTMLIEAFRKLLEPRFEVVGTVSDGRALLELAPVLRPDVLVLDISMPLMNGMEAGRKLQNMMPAVKLIYLTMNEDPEIALEAMRSGAAGYLLKKSAASELFQAIQAALRGRRYVTPVIAHKLRDSLVRNPRRERRMKTITSRQREVVQLLAEGKSMKEIAYILQLKPGTVAFHKYRIMDILGIKSSAALIEYAIRRHMISPQ